MNNNLSNQWCIVDNLELTIIKEFKLKTHAQRYFSMLVNHTQYGRFTVIELGEAREALFAVDHLGITKNDTKKWLEELNHVNPVFINVKVKQLPLLEVSYVEKPKKTRRKRLERSLSLQLPGYSAVKPKQLRLLQL